MSFVRDTIQPQNRPCRPDCKKMDFLPCHQAPGCGLADEDTELSAQESLMCIHIFSLLAFSGIRLTVSNMPCWEYSHHKIRAHLQFHMHQRPVALGSH